MEISEQQLIKKQFKVKENTNPRRELRQITLVMSFCKRDTLTQELKWN